MPLDRLFAVSLLAAAVIATPATANAHSRPNAVTAWSAYAGEAALAACIAPVDNPLNESRMYAMTHVAIHDALNAIDRRARPYAYDARVRRGASPNAAVAAAARDVLVPVLGQLQAPSHRRASTPALRASSPTTRPCWTRSPMADGRSVA